MPNFIDALNDYMDDSDMDADFIPGNETEDEEEENYEEVEKEAKEMATEVLRDPLEVRRQVLEAVRDPVQIKREALENMGQLNVTEKIQVEDTDWASIKYDPHPSIKKVGEGLYEVEGRGIPFYVKPFENICTGCRVKTRNKWCDHLISAGLKEGIIRSRSLGKVNRIGIAQLARNQREQNRRSGGKQPRLYDHAPVPSPLPCSTPLPAVLEVPLSPLAVVEAPPAGLQQDETELQQMMRKYQRRPLLKSNQVNCREKFKFHCAHLGPV